MGVALGVILTIAVGVPLMALAVVRRLPPPKRRPVQADAEYDWARRHRLGAPDHIRIQDAVRAGRRVQPERLMPAAREYAELVLARTRPRRSGRRKSPGTRPRTRMRLRTRRLIASACLVVYLIVAFHFFGNGWLAVIVLAVNLASTYYSRGELMQTREKAERALAANQDVDVHDSANGPSQSDLPPSLG